MSVDPRWLQILKASGWQTTAVAGAAAVLIYANLKKLLPTPLDPWMIQTAEVAFVVCVCLTLASVGQSVVKASKGLQAKLDRLWAIRCAKRQVADNIPRMTAKERQILGYLLAKNQTMFSSTADGGYANT